MIKGVSCGPLKCVGYLCDVEPLKYFELYLLGLAPLLYLYVVNF